MSDKNNQIKNLGNIANEFSSIIQKILETDDIDLAINQAHTEIIEKAIKGESINMDIIDFLCGYKKLIKRQRRCKNIADKAKSFIENTANPSNIDEGWLEFFFDKAKLICNDDMQLIWAKLLANEANNPGTINPSLLHTMSIIRYEQAEFFCNISRFAFRNFKADGVNLLIFVSTNREAYRDSKITPERLKDLERLGLIECSFENEYIFEKKKNLAFGNKVITIYGDPNNNRKIKAGNIKFTYDGEKLYSIIDESYKEYRNDILEFTIERFKNRGCTVTLNDLGNI